MRGACHINHQLDWFGKAREHPARQSGIAIGPTEPLAGFERLKTRGQPRIVRLEFAKPSALPQDNAPHGHA